MTAKRISALANYAFLRPGYLFESFVNDIWMLEMIVREEVELIQEIPDINATEGIHLRKGQHAWKSEPSLATIQQFRRKCVRKLFS